MFQDGAAPVDTETARFKLREGALDMLLDPVSNCEEMKVYMEPLPSAQGQPVQVAGSKHERARRIGESARALFTCWSKNFVEREFRCCFAGACTCTSEGSRLSGEQIAQRSAEDIRRE